VSSEIPENWISCEIGEVARVVGGGTPPSKDSTNFTTQGGTPWITPADLSGYKNIYINRGARNLTDKGLTACSAVKMPPGSVLFSSRAPVGYVAIASSEVTTNQGFKSFVLPDFIDCRFVYYYLRHIKPVAEMMATGTTFKELSGSIAAKLPFILAPINEQKRIADKLESLLTRVDACRERLDQVPLILKRFRQAVLSAATSGALTEEWASGGDWSTRKLGTLLTDVRYGTAKKSTYDLKDSTPVLRIPNIINGCVDTRDLKYGHFEKKEMETLSLKKGDLLIIRSNGSLDLVGKTAVVGEEVQGYLFAGYLIRLRVKYNLIDPHFLYFCLSSPDTRQHIESTARSTSGVNNINSEEIRSIEVKLPGINEQLEIVRRVGILFAFADRLEARYKAGYNQVERIAPSLLDKAFRGDLVPQDPNDEPAEKLFERINMTRSVTAGEPKQGRKSKREQKMEAIVIDSSQIRADHLSIILRSHGRQTAKALWQVSQLGIEDFYEQLRTEEARGLLREIKKDAESYLEAV
jgi:type I restriction enzyme S subunit